MKKPKLYIIKIGGKLIDDAQKLQETLENFASIKDYKILVHGGGKLADFYMKKMGINPKMENGRRITDAKTLEVVQMVYAGLTNKNIVARLQSLGCNAIGLSGADANSIKAKKRPVGKIDYGFAGDVTAVNNHSIEKLIQNDFTPVFCALTHDGNGQILNTNADTIAAELAGFLANEYETSLLFCFEKNGILSDQNDENSVFDKLTLENYSILKDQQIFTNGIIPKIDNAFNALNSGVENVHICHIDSIKNISDSIDMPTRIVLK